MAAVAALLMTGIVVVAMAVVVGAWTTWFRRSAASELAPAPAPDGRLRFILFRPAGSNFTIDAVVDQEGTGRLGSAGSAVTLKLHRPHGPREELALEQILRQWADEDQLVEVTLGDDSNIRTLQADGSRTRLHLMS